MRAEAQYLQRYGAARTRLKNIVERPDSALDRIIRAARESHALRFVNDRALMLGKNLLWVAKQHGHSVEVMLRMYAAWIEGATEADIQAIRNAMDARSKE
jgi:hypothetical protein